MCIFAGFAALYVNEEHNKKEQAKIKAEQEANSLRLSAQIAENAYNRLTELNPCFVSLLPPRAVYYRNQIKANSEKDIQLGFANNRDEAFSLMRDYLSFNQINATDVSETQMSILDKNDNIVEVATMIKFSKTYSSADCEKKLSQSASFLLRTKTQPKYGTLPSFDDLYRFDNSGSRRYYERRPEDEYAYRDITRYLESHSAKEGDV